MGPIRGNRRVLGAVLAAAGLAALGYGLAGLFTDTRATNPPNSLAWLVGGVLVHDLLLVPATVLAGVGLSRAIPAPYRAVTQGALIVSGSVTLMSLPLWRGYGGAPGNTSVNALPYGRNLAIVLGAVWVGAGILMLVRAWRRRAGHRPEHTGKQAKPPINR